MFICRSIMGAEQECAGASSLPSLPQPEPISCRCLGHQEGLAVLGEAEQGWGHSCLCPAPWGLAEPEDTVSSSQGR